LSWRKSRRELNWTMFSKLKLMLEWRNNGSKMLLSLCSQVATRAFVQVLAVHGSVASVQRQGSCPPVSPALSGAEFAHIPGLLVSVQQPESCSPMLCTKPAPANETLRIDFLGLLCFND
jgi:hypothetical protein